MRRAVTALALSLAGALVAPTAPAVAQQEQEADRLFAAVLSGAQEVPPVQTDAAGVASLRLDDATGELAYLVTSRGLEQTVAAHIHLGEEGENGPIVAALFGPVPGGIDRDGTLTRGTLADDRVTELPGETEQDPPVFDGTVESLVDELTSGNAYVNVHTVENPDGEIRGQVAELGEAPDFEDIATSAHVPGIEALARAGVTVGRTETRYEPRSTLTRAQMALFLDRSFELPDTDTDAFDDDDGNQAEPAINRVAAAGIAEGTGQRTFFPNQPVLRGQLASFLARGLALQEGRGLGLFPDGGSTHGEAIDALTVAGVIEGITPQEFGTNRPVDRGQSASLVARALALVPVDKPVGRTLTVLHNNDGESAVLPDGDEGGAGRFVAAVDAAKAEAEAETDGVVMLSSGDNFLAGPTFSASRETFEDDDPDNDTFYDALLLDRIGYDAIALGNHDFDFGPETLAEFIGEFPSAPQYLSANLDTDGTALAPLVEDGTLAPRTVVDAAGTRVGIVSVVTPALAAVSSPGDVEVDPDVAGVVQEQVDALESEGVDTIVLISHLQAIGEELALIPSLSGVDIVVGGGGDELLADDPGQLLPSDDPADILGPYPLEAVSRDGIEVPVVTTAGNYGYLGRLIAQLDPAGGFIAEGEGSQASPVVGGDVDAGTVAEVEDPVQAFVDELEETVVADSEVPLNGQRGDVRTVETNLGNLLSDAYAQQVGALTDEDQPLVGLQNGGGIRNDSVLPAGEVTRADTFDIVPFGNTLSITRDVDSEQLLAVVEHAVSNVENVDGRFGQFSGLRFDYDASAPAGSRVADITLDDGTEVAVGGEAVPTAPDVALALLNFTANGGDGYPLGEEAGLPFEALGVTEREAFEAFLTGPADEGALAGVITAEQYPEGGEGRITESS